MEIVFLGMNEAGEKVLDWLRNQEEVKVKAVITEREGLEKIRELKPSLVVSSGYEYIVPKEIIEIPEKGIVNLHPSYLPYNRGAHPYVWPIIHGTPAGVSVHFMNEELDEGPLVARREVKVRPDDNAKTLRERLMKEQASLFIENWEKILRKDAEEQDLEKGTVNFREDLDNACELDLERGMTLGEAIDLLRGLTYPPEKIAYFERNGEKYFISLDVEKKD